MSVSNSAMVMFSSSNFSLHLRPECFIRTHKQTQTHQMLTDDSQIFVFISAGYSLGFGRLQLQLSPLFFAWKFHPLLEIFGSDGDSGKILTFYFLLLLNLISFVPSGFYELACLLYPLLLSY